MKKIDLGHSLTLLANIGVIVGIVFLAIEIRGSDLEARAMALLDMGALQNSWYQQIIGSEDVARVYREGLADFDGLSDVDRERFDALMRSMFVMVTSTAAARGLLAPNPSIAPLEERLFEGYVFRHLDEPGFRRWLSTVDRRGLSYGAAVGDAISSQNAQFE